MLAIAANGVAIQKPIEEIQVGDRVLSYNEETGQNQVKTVSQTFTSSHEKVVKVRQSNGQVITSSYGHPYYTKRGWIAAENLKAGDILQTVNGETVVVEFVEHVLLESSVPLYNFEVDGNHNYYVADSAKADTSEFVLVHNKGCINSERPKNPVKLSDKYLKQNGLDSHSIKYAELGKKASISRYNIYIDRTSVDKYLWIGSNDGKVWINTLINFLKR